MNGVWSQHSTIDKQYAGDQADALYKFPLSKNKKGGGNE